MNPTQSLLDSITAGDYQAAGTILDRDPSAAQGVGPAGESPVLAALYRGQTGLARRIGAHRSLDITEAAAMGDTAAVAAALRRDPGSAGGRSHDGWTPLHLAAFFGQHAAATALVDAGADLAAVSQNGLENQPLHAALAGAGDSAIVTMLVERGADVNATSHGGWRPLHLAASRGAAAFVELLLAHGADPSAFASGKLPADIAAERGHAELARALRAAPPRMG